MVKLAVVVMAMAVTAASLVHAARGTEYVWKGAQCNTNFNEHDNWSGGSPLRDGRGVKTTVFFGSVTGSGVEWDPVSSLVHAGTYDMGALVLGGDGILEFQVDGPELVFFHPNETTGASTHFVGGQGTRPECDVNCHQVPFACVCVDVCFSTEMCVFRLKFAKGSTERKWLTKLTDAT